MPATVLRTAVLVSNVLKTHNPMAYSWHIAASGLKVTSLSLVFSVGSNLTYISKPPPLIRDDRARPDVRL